MSTTTVSPESRQRPRPADASRRPRVSGSDASLEDDDGHESEYDLLTAAMMGILIGAGVTFLFRQGPSGRPVKPILDGATRGLRWAGKETARRGKRGARWAAERGEEIWDRLPRDEVERLLDRQFRAARERIDDLLESEIRGLKKAIRRRRRSLGV